MWGEVGDYVQIGRMFSRNDHHHTTIIFVLNQQYPPPA
jgi:hypothetical protein